CRFVIRDIAAAKEFWRLLLERSRPLFAANADARCGFANAKRSAVQFGDFLAHEEEHVFRLAQQAAAMKAPAFLEIDTTQKPPDPVVVETVIVAQPHIDFVVTEQLAQQTPLERGKHSAQSAQAVTLGGNARGGAARIDLRGTRIVVRQKGFHLLPEQFRFVAPTRIDGVFVIRAAMAMACKEQL